MNRLPVVALFACLAACAQAEPQIFDCPLTVDFTESATKVPTKEWKQLRSLATRDFANLAVFDGHPSEKASLKPDHEPDLAAPSAIWRFPNGTSNNWLSCTYRGAEATLARRLPDGFILCTATYRGAGAGFEASGRLICDRAI